MSFQYDQYLENHRANVKRGYDWFCEYLPDVVKDAANAGWQTVFAHDQSKNEPDEYEAYDAYFYGNNRSYAVVQNYQRAWLLHLHRNPHHWQHWVLINDDPKEGESILEMPYDYIIEMICDWWAFSWKSGNLKEIFAWYDEHSKYMKLGERTRETVKKILGLIKDKLDELDNPGAHVLGVDLAHGDDFYCEGDKLSHHGVKGQKWGVKNGPPYPIQKHQKVARVVKHDNIVEDAIRSGKVSKTINKDKQKRHTKDDHIPGRSYLDGDCDYAQELVDKLSGTGEAKLDSNGNWTRKEMVTDSNSIGTHVSPIDGAETRTNKGTIIYSKTGTHIYPRLEED